jgi:hypothetical protein
MTSIFHLELIFPALLTYSFFVPLLLRVFIAGILLLDARKYWDKKERWWIPDGVALVAAVFFLAGYATQLAAIIGIGYLAFVFYKKDHDSVFNSKPLAFLAFAVFVSLLVTGSGAFALDLPY